MVLAGPALLIGGIIIVVGARPASEQSRDSARIQADRAREQGARGYYLRLVAFNERFAYPVGVVGLSAIGITAAVGGVVLILRG